MCKYEDEDTENMHLSELADVVLCEYICSKSVPNQFEGAQTLDFTVFFSCVNLRILSRTLRKMGQDK